MNNNSNNNKNLNLNKNSNNDNISTPNHNHNQNKVTLLKFNNHDLTWFDQCSVVSSSLIIGTALLWVPCVYVYVYKKWKSIPPEKKRLRYLYGFLIVSITYLLLFGKHRSVHYGNKYFKFKEWKLWSSWMRFCALEVIKDYASSNNNHGTNTTTTTTTTATKQQEGRAKKAFDFQKDQAILAFVPHGIFPFALAASSVPEEIEKVFGSFRQVVATATTLLPIVRDILAWDNTIDASKPSVNHALQKGDRIGIIPGGIKEMFESYPKPLVHPNEECAVIPKGFIKMAMKHNIPIIPVYLFGLSNMFRRVHGNFLEKMSTVFRISLCLFFGQCGLPIPFRTKLLFTIGEPIFPPTISTTATKLTTSSNSAQQQKRQQQVDEMHRLFCHEIISLFDRYKHYYGWGEKSLRIISE